MSVGVSRVAAWAVGVLVAGASLIARGDNPAHDALTSAGYVSTRVALVTDRRVDEISGLAASRRDDRLLWVLNDSDNGNFIYALGTDGAVRARVTVQGATNIDWEDMAGFELDGQPWLAVADTGDNGGLRSEISVYVLREPELHAKDTEVTAQVAWRVRIRWPDGPRDCEAMTIDPRAREILLLSKKRVPAQFFRVPLDAAKDPAEVRVAEQIASIGNLPQPTDEELATAPRVYRYASQITAMDLSADGDALAVLTYRDGYLYRREPGETWAQTLARAPLRLDAPVLLQAEALGFAAKGRQLWESSEKLPAPLIRFDTPAP